LYVPPDYFGGKTIDEILPPSAAAVIAQALTEAEQTGRHAGAVYCLPMPAGEQWFELSISTKAEPGKTRPHFMVLSRDITRRK
jgi:hypothetical protein